MNKYSLPEIEKRRTTHIDLLPDLTDIPYCDITDYYLPQWRLRLRKEEYSDTRVRYKLCKKYGKSWPITEEIVNIYLEESEYKLLLQIWWNLLKKRRYFLPEFDINIFESWIITIEREFNSEQEANSFIPPTYCIEEVSSSKQWESASIAHNQ